MQGLDDMCSDIWRGGISAFDPKCLKYANEAKLLFKDKDRSMGPTTTSTVVRGIPQLNGIVDNFLGTVDGTIKCMPLYEETMKKLECEDVTCTDLLQASECLAWNQDTIRKELALESCESIWRKVDVAEHRCFLWAIELKEIGAFSPDVTRAQDTSALFGYVQSHFMQTLT